MDKLLAQLCAARGVSGNEAAVREIILREAAPFAEKIESTPLGGVLVWKKGLARAKKALLLDAHMDEVGFLVTHVTEEGFLKFAPVGGVDARVLPGRAVRVGDGPGIPGVIGAKPIHLLTKEERGRAVPGDDLYVDIGARDRADALRTVLPGDMVTFDSPYTDNGYTICGRALDDRAGCALLLHCIQREDWAYDAVFSFSVQEETGLNGAKTAAFAARPQAAIVVESTTAADVPGTEKDDQVCRLGAGPVLSFMDRRTIYDRAYARAAFDIARQAGLPCQWKEAVAGGNNAGAIHQSRAGVRTAAVSLACRYLHAPVGVIRASDYAAAQRLLPLLAAQIASGALG